MVYDPRALSENGEASKNFCLLECSGHNLSLACFSLYYCGEYIMEFISCQNNSFNSSSASQKECGKELSKVVCGKERSNNSHVTIVTPYPVY